MGKRKAGEVLLALDERMARCRHVIKISGKAKEGVRQGLEILRRQYGSLFSKVFRSITSDNGSEFSGLSKLFKEGKVYFAHPYSSGERGTNEKHNFPGTPLHSQREGYKCCTGIRGTKSARLDQQTSAASTWLSHTGRAFQGADCSTSICYIIFLSDCPI